MQDSSLKFYSDFEDVLRFIEARKNNIEYYSITKDESPFLYEKNSDQETSDEQIPDGKTVNGEILHKESFAEVATHKEILEQEIPDEQTSDEVTPYKEILEEKIDNEETFDDLTVYKETLEQEIPDEKISDERTTYEESLSWDEKNITEGLKPDENKPDDIKNALVEEKSETSINDGSENKGIIFEKTSVKKILLVDDDMVLRKSIYHSLCEDGFYVVEADNGMDAIKKVQTEHFDQIVLYFEMKMLGGMELIHLLRKELGLNTPVIVLTSSGEKEAHLESFALVNTEFTSAQP